MPAPDLSNLRAVIADDRPEVRDLIAARLRELGVSRIDAVSPGTAGIHLLGLASGDAMAGAAAPTSPEQLAEFVARFTHDIGSPLTTALLNSRILATGMSDRPTEDARLLLECVEEIAGLVRMLARQVASTDPRRPRPS
jgi:signal transduction histidine kinase